MQLWAWMHENINLCTYFSQTPTLPPIQKLIGLNWLGVFLNWTIILELFDRNSCGVWGPWIFKSKWNLREYKLIVKFNLLVFEYLGPKSESSFSVSVTLSNSVQSNIVKLFIFIHIGYIISKLFLLAICGHEIKFFL